MYRLYTLLLGLGLILTLPYYVIHFRKYVPAIRERLGHIAPETGGPTIWVHAVSVGEVKAIDGLIDGLRAQFPGRRILVSTTTATGRRLALGQDGVDRVVYFPLDFPRIVGRSLDRIRPEMVIVAETEIWPNFLRQCSQRHIPVFMVNGRISDQSYGRYRLARPWLGRVLQKYRVLGMQSEIDADRIRAMGAPPNKVMVFGNMKYDVRSSPSRLDDLLADSLGRWQPLVVAASTAAEEELMVLDAFRRLGQTHPDLKLLIAPRLPERFDEVAETIGSAGFAYARRSDLAPGAEVKDVLLLDSIGELTWVFEHASVVFMGGTLVPRGGHNVLEPAWFSKPVVFGPHMENFRDMARTFLRRKAAIQVADVEDLVAQVRKLLETPSLAREMGQNARQLVDENQGATVRALAAIHATLNQTHETPGPVEVAR